jgi:L-ascorbate metabolism protein UlaG (beta-lactamase superfamily)
MTALRLAPIRWSLVPEADGTDIDSSLAEGGSSLADGYRHASSLQSIFFQPGTIRECKSIELELSALNKKFPSVEDAERAFDRVRGRNPIYRFEKSESIWHIRNESKNDFSSRFGTRDARLIFELPRRQLSIKVPAGRILPTLELIESLACGQPIDKILKLASSPEGDEILGGLIAGGGVVSMDATRRLDVRDLPELLFLGHSSFAVRSAGTLVVFDPVALPGNLVASEPDRPLMEIIRAASFIVMSHHHWDHVHFQTLCQIPKNIPLLVPRVIHPSLANPPIAAYLKSLRFSEVRECEPGEMHHLGDVQLRLFPFYGEAFGLGSHFDGFSYHVSFSGRTLFGSVDTCFDEAGDMEETINEVAKLGAPDFFLFGSSGQQHNKPYKAAGLRHFSNELILRPDLLRYHPNVSDAERWAKMLNPRFLIPYAEFIFRGTRSPDLPISEIRHDNGRNLSQGMTSFAGGEDRTAWFGEIKLFAERVSTPIVMLNPMQGIRLS